MKRRAGPRRPDTGWLAVGLLASAWGLGVGWLAIRQHLAFHTGYDLGVFTQVVWATASGRPFYTSLPLGTTQFLGHHFCPLLAVLIPLYALWPDARCLLVAQTLALAAGALPLYAFARRRLGPRLALALVAAYLLNPALHTVALVDFHEIALAVPLLMGAGAALLERRPRAAALWLVPALLAKEEVGLIAVGMGLYLWLVQRERRAGMALTAAAVAWTALLFGWIMPAPSPTVGGFAFRHRYATLAAAWGAEIRVEAATALPVWLAWKGGEPLDRRVTFTLHLLDTEGCRVSQVDQEMRGGRFPTTLWQTWLGAPLVADQFDLPIPASLAPGRYRLLAGAYDSETVVLLSRPDGQQWFELAALDVVEPSGPTP